MADLSGMSTEQLLALAQQAQQPPQQSPLASIPTEQLMAMAQNHPEAKAAPGMLDQFGRQLGLTGRYALEGAGNLAGVVSDPFGQFLPGYQKTGEAASALADTLGLPKPETKLEKTVGGASKALVGTGLTAGAGAIPELAALGAQPGIQAASAALGGGVQEATDNPWLGALASLAPGAKALGSMATRGALRGSDAKGMQDAIQSFEAAGTTPTAGQAAQGGIASTLESLLAKAPGGSGVMGRKIGGQAEDIGNKVGQMADTLAPGSDATTAGEAIQRGITGENGAISDFKKQASTLYDAVDQHMPPDTAVPMQSTSAFLTRATTPTQGAAATSALLTNPKLAQVAKAIATDTAGSGAMPYSAVKDLRTRVGSMLADSGLTADVPKAELKQLYGSLSDDLRAATTAQGPEAAAANNQAENFYRNGIDKIERVENVVGQNGGPEAVFKAAMSGTRDGATTLSNVVSMLKPDEANEVASTVMRRMGRATPGNQNDAGDVFSPQTFLSNWSAMSPRAKSVLFSRMPDGFAGDMDQIAKTASLMKEAGKVVPNAPGTAAAAAHVGTAGAFVLSLAHGNLPAAGAIAGGVAATNLGARAMTNPTFVKWLARNTTAPVGVLPAQLGYLDQLGKKNNDPTLSDAAQQISAALGPQTQ